MLLRVVVIEVVTGSSKMFYYLNKRRGWAQELDPVFKCN